MSPIYITSKKLIETLKIDATELVAIEQFFDAHDDDKWEVVEGKDYKIVANNGLREYTCSGAFAIAEYLEFKRQSGGWFKKVLRKFILALKGDIRKSFVKQQILNNSSSLAVRNGAYFLSRADVIAIFGTNSGYLTKMLNAARKSDKTLLVLDEDYIGDPDKGTFFALSGMMKLGQVFSENITRRNRKDWCKDVGDVVTPCVFEVLKLIKQRNEQIAKAKKQAKTRANRHCQVTGKIGNKVNPIPMAGHHLYSRAEYPHLVDNVENIICIRCEVHDHFHQFMGGSNVPCTLDDFERFIQVYYPASPVTIWLQQQRLKLGNQRPITLKERHVLHLPWPIPKLLPLAK